MDELAAYLERRIAEIEVKLKGAVNDLGSLKEEHALIIAKITKERRKF